MAGCDENNSRFLALTGYGQDYGSKESRLALAIADASIASSIGAADVAQGINDSVDIDTIIGLLQSIDTALDCPAGTYVEKIGSVGTTGTPFEPALATRTAVQIQNTSGVDMYIRFGNTATATTGFRIKPDGMFYSQIEQQVTQSISLVADAANSSYVGFVIQ